MRHHTARLASLLIALTALACGGISAATITADSASQAHVQAAVNAASDGDTVLIPNGSATWTSGISTTKQIIIRAQNYTPTSGGATSRSVVITHDVTSAPLFAMTSGNSYHCGIGGIEFARGTSDRSFVRFSGSGSKPPLLFDCYFEDRGAPGDGSAEDDNLIAWLSLGGVMWNCRVDAESNWWSSDDRGVNIAKAGIHFKSPRAWTTASTMGTLDTGGLVNVYIEDSTFINAGTGDIDDNARVVLRYSTFNGTRWITHGFTSAWGGRHWESYNNTYQVLTSPRNMAGSYFWCRAGTGVFTDNVVNNTSAPSDYGSVSLLSIYDNTTPSAYPQNRQMGGGHNGTTYVSDPIYMWNNTGAQAATYSIDASWASNVQINRDLFVNSGAKPDYTKYTYPHPLREYIEDPAPDDDPPTLSSAVIPSAGTTLALTWNENATRTTGTPTLSLSGGAATASYSSGSGTTETVFSLSRTVMSGETGTFSLSGGIEDAAENEIAPISGQSITNNSTQEPESPTPGNRQAPAKRGLVLPFIR